jgi:hypothetical protein
MPFEREYRTLASLRHQSIVEVYDYGTTIEGPFYTMCWVCFTRAVWCIAILARATCGVPGTGRGRPARAWLHREQSLRGPTA